MVGDIAGTAVVPALGFQLWLVRWRVVLEKQQIVPFDGRITVDNSNEMRERLRAALKPMPKALTVDLSQVTSIDISGLATLVEATRMARRQGTRLVLAGIQGQPAYLLEVARLDQLFDIAAEQQST